MLGWPSHPQNPRNILGVNSYLRCRHKYGFHQAILKTENIGASHIVVKGFSIGPGWAPTAKLNFQARLLRQHQVFEGDPNAILGVTPLRQEFIRGYRLGSYWEYSRQVHFTFSVDHGERESNILGRNYRYNAGIAQVSYIF